MARGLLQAPTVIPEEVQAIWVDPKLILNGALLQEKTKIVTEISVNIPSQIMFSDGFVTEFLSSLNFVTEICQKFVTKIVSVTKNSVVIKCVFVIKL